jgi:hypothetical protein
MKSRQTLAAVLGLAALIAAWLWMRPATPVPKPLPIAVPPDNFPVSDVSHVVAKTAEETGAATKPPNPVRETLAARGSEPSRTAAPIPTAAPRVPSTVYMPRDPTPPEGYHDLETTSRMLKNYREMMGENPVGNNADIMKSMMGGNKKGAMLGPPEGLSMNSNGELMDRWGTPIFFHALSKDQMEIRSAGPDRVMWTADDVILK